MAINNQPTIEPRTVTGIFTKYIAKTLPLAFDESMSYYECLCAMLEYLNDTIVPDINNVNDGLGELQTLYLQLQDYVNNYFDNLDVQEEINNKLDEMAQDGSLTQLIKNYVDPLIDEQNNRIKAVENELTSVASGSPAGVYDTVTSLTTADPDHNKIYVVTADGKWYYYNGTQWTAGGTYQSSGIENFSITYQKLNPFKNGNQNITWINGYIASENNPDHDEGYIDPNSYSAGYKRSTPIALTKGMILIYKTSALNNINALSRVNENNQFIETIEAGTDTAGSRVRVYKCNVDNEFVCIGNITQYIANPSVDIYNKDFNLENLVNRYLHDITSPLTKGFLSDTTSPYGSNILVLASNPSTATRYFTDFIKVKKGQILYTNAAVNATNIDIIGLFNEDFTYNSTILVGYNNSDKNNNHYYTVENNGYIIITNDSSLVSNSNLKIQLYNSFDEIYNINGYQQITPVWKNYYMNASSGAIVPTTNSYQTTEKIPLKKGDVISGFTASTTNGAAKIAISDGINYSSLIIINNNDSTSDYYDPSYRFNYVATTDCFVEIINKIDMLSQENTEIFINPMCSAISNVYNKKFTAIGDSYIANQNQQCGYTWMSLFANKYGAEYIMRGIGGTGLVVNNTYGNSVLNRLNTIPSDTDFILVVGGKNDYNDQTALNTFKTGIASIITGIQTNNPTAKLMFATPWNTYGDNDTATIKLKDYADAIEEVCKEYCVPCFNSFYDSNMYLYNSTFRTNYAQASNDGSHLNINGHKRMEERIETFLKAI